MRRGLNNFWKSAFCVSRDFGAVCIILSATSAKAEIYNCEGRWTNRPCEGKVVQTLDASDTKRSVLSPVEAQERNKKESLLHELTMLSLRARRDHDIRIPIGSAQRTCEGSEHTIEECESAVAKLEAEISSRLRDAERLAIEREELEIKRKRSGSSGKDEPQDPITEGYSENQTIIITGRRRHRGKPDYRHPPIIDERKILFRPNEVYGERRPNPKPPRERQRAEQRRPRYEGRGH